MLTDSGRQGLLVCLVGRRAARRAGQRQQPLERVQLHSGEEGRWDTEGWQAENKTAAESPAFKRQPMYHSRCSRRTA